MNIYDDEIKLRHLLCERGRLELHENTQFLHNDSYVKYVKTKEYNMYCINIKSMPMEELITRTRYHNAPYRRNEFEGYEEIMELVSRGSLEEGFIYKQKERHRHECEIFEYIYIPMCIIPETAMYHDAENYLVMISDPFGSICTTASKEVFNLNLLNTPCLAEIGITSLNDEHFKITKIRPLQELKKQREKHLEKYKDSHFVSVKKN